MMKIARVKRYIVSVLLVCIFAAISIFVVGAVNARNSGTRQAEAVHILTGSFIPKAHPVKCPVVSLPS